MKYTFQRGQRKTGSTRNTKLLQELKPHSDKTKSHEEIPYERRSDMWAEALHFTKAELRIYTFTELSNTDKTQRRYKHKSTHGLTPQLAPHVLVTGLSKEPRHIHCLIARVTRCRVSSCTSPAPGFYCVTTALKVTLHSRTVRDCRPIGK
jgi:hypothetical protein